MYYYYLCIPTKLVRNNVKCISYSRYGVYSLRCLITRYCKYHTNSDGFKTIGGIRGEVTICETRIPFAYIGESTSYFYIDAQ